MIELEPGKSHFAICITQPVFTEWLSRCSYQKKPFRITDVRQLQGLKAADCVFHLLDGYEICEVVYSVAYAALIRLGAVEVIYPVGAERTKQRKERHGGNG